MLMKVVANNSRSTVQLIEIELSKAYLYRALRCKDSDSDSIYCLANVYLAVLYYVTGQYQTAIDHCKLVTRSQDHSQCSSHVVQGELLPKIDDDIDNVLGLSVFYQYVRTAALNHKVTKVAPYNSAFTTELFAHCVKNYGTSKHEPPPGNEIQRYRKHLYECTDMFITDALVFCLISRTQYNAVDNQRVSMTRDQTKPVMSCQLDTSELVELLQLCAVEYLTEFRHRNARDFGYIGSEQVGTVRTDVETMYAYKCGEYRRCLKLSTHSVRTLLAADDVEMPYIISCPEFIQLMDDNIASVIGLTVIVNMSSTDNVDHVVISQLTLSLYLMSQCQMKLHHSATSLAQTLHHVEVESRNSDFTLDQLLLKLTQRKILHFLVIIQPCFIIVYFLLI